METLLLPTDTPARLAAAVQAAVVRLEAGEPVALPTETVYGLAADALSSTAATRIFEAKERPFFDPLICHLPDLSWLEQMTTLFGKMRARVEALAMEFWPGPLTMVLPRASIVPDIVTSGLDTVALRMSAHPVFAAVVSEFRRPLAAPSANRFGRISPTTGEHVLAELSGRIPLVVEGGPALHGLESTIVAVEPGDRLRILRPGPIAAEDLARFGTLQEPRSAGEVIEAPGQLKSHYAPRTPMRLLAWGEAIPQAPSQVPTALLSWQQPAPAGYVAHEVLSPSGDLREAAATLFAKLRRLDESGVAAIICESVPAEGLGHAILDRLRKGAALG